MNTLPIDLYKVIEYGLGGDTWQEFIDRYKEKYDLLQIDGFEFEATKLDYTFSQLITSLGVKTLPAYVDPESPGYEAALGELEGRTGNIPTQKKFYRLNRVTVRQQLQLLQRVGMSALTEEMQNVFLGLLDESADGLIGSYYNALTHQRMRIVSTGKFTIDTDNNPRGLKGITIDFNIPENHYQVLAGTSRWWTKDEHIPANQGSASDPIMDVKNRVKEIRRKYHYLGKIRMELAQDLWDDLMTHTAVLKRIGHSLYPTVTDDSTVIANAQNEDEDRLKAIFKKLVKVDEIVPRDSYAFVDKPGKDADGQPDLSFDLDLPAYRGNCDGCWLKKQADLARIMHEIPDPEFWFEMEEMYPKFGGIGFGGYRRLAAEYDVRLKIENRLRAGQDTADLEAQFPKRRRYLSVLKQEQYRLDNPEEGVSCSCEASTNLPEEGV